MDNGALVFIVIIEAIVIVWQASKLKQYDKFEHLLNANAAPAGSQSAASVTAVTDASASPPESPPASSTADTTTGAASLSGKADAASRAVASAVGGAVDGDGDDDELLDMPGVDPEANIEEAKRLQLVMARCRYAEFYLEQLDDDYERGQFQRILNSCKTTARNISDPFFRSSAIHPIVVLLDRAEWTDERDQLLAEVDDEMIRQRIDAELAADTVKS
ncbi:hypothetical protein OAM69_07350 [bacterium]|nr:hypothetical protein [bacterium]